MECYAQRYFRSQFAYGQQQARYVVKFHQTSTVMIPTCTLILYGHLFAGSLHLKSCGRKPVVPMGPHCLSSMADLRPDVLRRPYIDEGAWDCHPVRVIDIVPCPLIETLARNSRHA